MAKKLLNDLKEITDAIDFIKKVRKQAPDGNPILMDFLEEKERLLKEMLFTVSQELTSSKEG